MKKIIALIFAAALLCTLCVPAFAQNISDQLTEVMLAAKATLGIDDRYSDFTGSQDGDRWNLNWSDGNTELGVACGTDGTVYSYNLYQYNDFSDNAGGWNPRFPKTSEDEVKAVADEFLGRVLTGEEGWVYDSEITGELERNGNDSLYLQGRLTYQGYPTDVRFSLTVDLTAEAVTNYYRYDAYMTFDGAQASTDSTVDQQTALEKLKGLVTVEPVYQVVKNGEMAKLVYRFTGLDGKVVRCSDGEILDTEEFIQEYARDGAMGKSAMAYQSANAQLTEVELQGVARYEGALPAEELDQRVRAMEELGLTEEYELTSTSYYDDGTTLTANLNYARKLSAEEMTQRYGDASVEDEESDTLDVTVNAATGALISLYTYQPGMLTKDRPAFTAADFQATADAFAQKYFPDQWTNLKCTQVAEDVSMYSYARTADFTYTRQYNGYSFYENSLTVSVDVDTGKIVFAGLIWNDGQEFEEPQGTLLTAEEALDAYLKALTLENGFVSVAKDPQQSDSVYEKVFCWRLYSDTGVYAVDAVTGETYGGYSGQESARFAYDDIAGNVHESEIATLGKYGVGFSGGQFQPDKAFTARDMLSMILQASGYTGVEEMDYPDLVSSVSGLGKVEISGYSADDEITRAAFARLLVSLSGYGDVAQLSGIYNCAFADNDQVAQEDYGYVAIAYGMGLIQPDENGAIRAGETLTRGEAAAVLCNLLSRR